MGLCTCVDEQIKEEGDDQILQEQNWIPLRPVSVWLLFLFFLFKTLVA